MLYQQSLLPMDAMEFSRRRRRRRRRDDDELPAMSWDLVVAIYNGKINRSMPSDFYGPGFITRKPTQHAPGTDGKIAVLSRRARRCEQLFHLEDNRGN